MEKLIDEWTEAENGFAAGIDFKTWLANELIAARKILAIEQKYCSCGGEGYVMLMSGAKICNICQRHKR